MRRLIVDDLIAEVRSMLDEENVDNITDSGDIIPALNRGQDYAANILAKHYEPPLIKSEIIELVGGQDRYPIPDNAFEQRLEKVEVKVNNVFQEVKRISYRDLTYYESPSAINIPYYYAILDNEFQLVPKPSGTYPIRIWYLEDPEPLVKNQGRITLIDQPNNYIIVDSVGLDLTTETTDLMSYVNIVDGGSGEIKQSLQIKQINGNKITFKSVPSRTSVLNREISSSLSDNVEFDDYVCVIHGSCVPFLKKPVSNFLIQYAVNEIKINKLREAPDALLALKQDLEEQVERSWAGREQAWRVKRRSRSLTRPLRTPYTELI